MYGSLPTKLRVLRAERGLTLRDAERLTSVDKDTLSKIERGRRDPQDITLAKIAKGYGVPVEELLEEPVPLGEAGLTLKQASREPAMAAELPGLKSVRERRGMSRNELAARADIAVAQIEDLEEGRRLTEPVAVDPLASALGVSTGELIFPVEQYTAFLSEIERDNKLATRAGLTAAELKALRLASPAFRKLAAAFDKSQEQRDQERPEAG